MTKDTTYFEGVGRRKRAVARVRVTTGTGSVKVNEKDPKDYFPSTKSLAEATGPLSLVGLEKKVDVSAKITGGGKSAHAGALSHGLARALVAFDPELRITLAKNDFLRRDPREKERKKYGLKRARKAPQFTKR